MRGGLFRKLISDVLLDPERTYYSLALVLQATTLDEVGPHLEDQSRGELGLSMQECVLTSTQLDALSAVFAAVIEEEYEAPSRWLLSALVYLYDDRAVLPVVRLLERRLDRAPGWEAVDVDMLTNCYLMIFVFERPHPLAKAVWKRLAASDDPQLLAAVAASTPK